MSELSSTEYPELPSLVFDKKYVEEKVVSLYFQANRKTAEALITFSELLKSTLDYLVCRLSVDYQESKNYLTLLYRMIGQTRDCFSHGKGEQQVSYAMIYVWYSFFPDLSLYAARSFVSGKYPYGSWRDIKYLCQYVRSQSNENHPIIHYCIWLMNQSLHNDFVKYFDFCNKQTNDSNDSNSHLRVGVGFDSKQLTLIAKWVPRENKRFDWLFNLLVIDWFSTYQTTFLSKCEYQSIKYFAALSKCKRMYRQMVSTLNSKIDTIECHLCSKNYNKIKPELIPQIAFMKYKDLLLNRSKKIIDKPSEISDLGSGLSSDGGSSSSGICYDYINKKISEQHIAMHFYLKHFPNDLGCYEEPCQKKMLSNIPLAYYVSEAIKMITASETTSEFTSRNIITNRELLNKQWAQLSSSVGIKKLHGFIPFLDMSESMYGEQLHTAIGIACLIAERTTFGKKILVYDNQPTWINLDCCSDGNFVSMIECIYRSTLATTKTRSNISSAVQLLLDALVTTNYTDLNIRVLKFVFISNQYSTFHNITIKNLFSAASKQLPIIVHWNISSSWVDDLKVDPGCFYFSGESIYPLKMLDINHIATPYEVVRQVVRHERYDLLDKYVCSNLS
uniref:TROVE domain-containing protein n=1 Tax=viral metagenome TaxID=1070528 RepID=A0A6C0DRK5_9ZZZZ